MELLDNGRRWRLAYLAILHLFRPYADGARLATHPPATSQMLGSHDTDYIVHISAIVTLTRVTVDD